jgi:mRNA turnover protein 4
MRNQKLKDLREQLKSSSRIFLAGKKVMQIALGRSPADEAKTGLHKLSKVTFSFLNTWHIIQSTPFL